MHNELSGTVLLILGASSGIGRATAVLAARAGATVIAAARREDRLQALQEELAVENIRIAVQKADAASAEEVAALVAGVVEEFGRIDAAVYACGTNAPDRAMKTTSAATWDHILETNLAGAFYLSHAVLPAMRAAGKGHLIFVSSTAGVLPDLSGAAYQASKRGLLGLAHAIRLEERAAGIRTCCILPGLTNTELVEKRPEKLSADVLEKALQPQDVADAILFVLRTPERVTIPELLMVPSLA